MKLISEYAGQKIWFVQPSVWKRQHEFRVNDELVGTIQQKKFFKVMWEVKIDNKGWEIYRESFFRSKMLIREMDHELPFAELLREGLRSKWLLSLPKGERLKIVPHLFKGYCELKNEMEECLVRIKPKASFKEKAEVTVEKKSDLVDKYPWSVVLAYIIIMEQKHQAAHAAV